MEINETRQKMFIKVGNKKQPIEKWQKDPKARYTAAEITAVTNMYAVVPPEGYVIIDCDAKHEMEIVGKICYKLGINPVWWNTSTTEKAHFLFKIPMTKLVPPKKMTSINGRGKSNNFNILGLKDIDWKGENGGYAVLTNRANPLDVERLILEDKVPELPLMLYANPAKFNIHNFEEGSRHDTIFRTWVVYLRRAFTNEPKIIIDIIMEFLKYLDDTEFTRADIETQVMSSFEKGVIETESVNSKYGPYLLRDDMGISSSVINYEKFFETLINSLELKIDPETRQIWGKNLVGSIVPLLKEEIADSVKREVFTNEPNIKPSILSEIITAIPSRVPVVTDTVTDTQIALANGVYDAETNQFTRREYNYFTKNKIQLNWIEDNNWKENNKVIIDWLDKYMFIPWCSLRGDDGTYDPEMKKELLEILGLSMTKYTGFEKFFMLVGDSGNGKSEFVRIIQAILGRANYTAIELKALSDGTFDTAQLYGKIANIVTDLSAATINDTAILKRVVSGEDIAVQNKGEPIFILKPVVKLIFALNAWPYLNEQGESSAIDRRIKGVWFLNKFEKLPDWGKMRKYLLSPQTLEVLIKMGAEALHNALIKGKLTDSRNAKLLYDKYLLDTDPAFEFVKSNPISDGDEVAHVYIQYKTWCDENSYKVANRQNFVKKMMKWYNRQKTVALVTSTMLKNNKQTMVFIFKNIY